MARIDAIPRHSRYRRPHRTLEIKTPFLIMCRMSCFSPMYVNTFNGDSARIADETVASGNDGGVYALLRATSPQRMYRPPPNTQRLLVERACVALPTDPCRDPIKTLSRDASPDHASQRSELSYVLLVPKAETSPALGKGSFSPQLRRRSYLWDRTRNRSKERIMNTFGLHR